jgi:deoxyribonuclease-4
MKIGSHVERGRIFEGARDRLSDVVQINLTAPQTWRSPSAKGDEEKLLTSGLSIYVHAPYLVNPSSMNPEVRLKSIRCLKEQLNYVERIGAKGLVVHGGHPTGSGSSKDAENNWLEVLTALDMPVNKILIENTAGGKEAVARKIPTLTSFFQSLRGNGFEVGFCLDTCHAWAGGMEQFDLVENIVKAVGKINLVHVNNSKDLFDSSRDRHENLNTGVMNPETIIQIVKDANIDCVVETPGGVELQKEDVRYLREKLEIPYNQ